VNNLVIKYFWVMYFGLLRFYQVYGKGKLDICPDGLMVQRRGKPAKGNAVLGNGKTLAAFTRNLLHHFEKILDGLEPDGRIRSTISGAIKPCPSTPIALAISRPLPARIFTKLRSVTPLCPGCGDAHCRLPLGGYTVSFQCFERRKYRSQIVFHCAMGNNRAIPVNAPFSAGSFCDQIFETRRSLVYRLCAKVAGDKPGRFFSFPPGNFHLKIKVVVHHKNDLL